MACPQVSFRYAALQNFDEEDGRGATMKLGQRNVMVSGRDKPSRSSKGPRGRTRAVAFITCLAVLGGIFFAFLIFRSKTSSSSAAGQSTSTSTSAPQTPRPPKQDGTAEPQSQTQPKEQTATSQQQQEPQQQGQAQQQLQTTPQEQAQAPAQAQAEEMPQEQSKPQEQPQPQEPAQAQDQKLPAQPKQPEEQNKKAQDQQQPQSQEEQKKPTQDQPQTQPKPQEPAQEAAAEQESQEDKAQDAKILAAMKAGGYDPMLDTLSPEAQKWREFFSDVLLVVAFDRGHNSQNMTQASKAIRQLYGRVFRRILVVGPQKFADWGVTKVDTRAEGEDHKDSGGFSYSALAELALPREEQPQEMQDMVVHGLAGVLWMDSDVVLNYWRLSGHDKSKVWLPTALMSSPHFKFLTFSAPRKQDNEFSVMPLSEEQHMGKLEKIWSQWPDWARLNYLARQQELHSLSGDKVGEVAMFHGLVPVFYLPKAAIDRLKPLVELLRSSIISREFAVPLLIMSAAEQRERDDALDEFPSAPTNNLDIISQLYNVLNPGICPWDYATKHFRAKLLTMMKAGDRSLGPLLDVWRRQ